MSNVYYYYVEAKSELLTSNIELPNNFLATGTKHFPSQTRGAPNKGKTTDYQRMDNQVKRRSKG